MQFVMLDTERLIKAHLDEEHAELHYECGGFWDAESIDEMFAVLSRTSAPLVKAGKPFSGLGDFSRAMPQDQATAQKMGEHLQMAAKAGYKRSAIVGASALFKLQYRRVSQGIEVEYFDDRDAAIKWLRAGK